jgi:nitrite reductase/ring-hydroxylating ferredoxin subunit
MPVASGEMLVFDPQIPHGTHLNTTDTTRLVVSMRLNASEPTFDPVCFYAREFWRRADDIECGRDEILHLRREDHLAEAAAVATAGPRGTVPVVPALVDPASGVVRGPLVRESAGARRIVLQAPGHRIVVVRTRDGLRAYDAACPHYALDLADGACDDDKIYCPRCAVEFDLRTGRSDCPTLTLRSFEVWEDDGSVNVRVGS